jgi:hypothetical protein
MNRRSLLKQLALTGAAVILLPNCENIKVKPASASSELDISPDDERLMSVIADAIIPEDSTVGAKSVNAHLFALMMVDDMCSIQEKQRYQQGKELFKEKIRTATGLTFERLDPQKRIHALQELERNSELVDPRVKYFYLTFKHYVVMGYTSSKHYLTTVKPYQLIPGPSFQGCVDLS